MYIHLCHHLHKLNICGTCTFRGEVSINHKQILPMGHVFCRIKMKYISRYHKPNGFDSLYVKKKTHNTDGNIKYHKNYHYEILITDKKKRRVQVKNSQYYTV